MHGTDIRHSKPMTTMGTMRILVLFLIATMPYPTFSDEISMNFSMVFKDMLLKTNWIYQDCYNGKLSGITFTEDYTYAAGIFCMHNNNPLIPVEWTANVEELVRFGDKARSSYGDCISNRTCEKDINMIDWKELAKEQYTACKYCTNITEGGACLNYKTVTDKDQVIDIIHSMYLVVKYTCTVESNSANQILIANVTNGSGSQYSIMKVDRDSFRCNPGEIADIQHITERAKDYRFRVKEENQDLVSWVQHALNNTTEFIKIPVPNWTVYGGYQRSNGTNGLYPYSIVVHYECIAQPIASRTSMSEQLSTTLSQDVEAEDEKAMSQATATIIASGIVLCILTATILALSLTIRNIRKHNNQTTV